MQGVRFALALACASWCLSAPARAAVSPWATWQAPEGCPSEAEFVQQTEVFLGKALNARGDRALEIVGKVQSDPERGFVAQLRVATTLGTQERELIHRDCAELTEAAALVAALAIDPELIVPPKKPREEPPTLATPVEEAPAPEAPTSAPVPPASEPRAASNDSDRPLAERSPSSFHPALAVLGTAGTSVLPGAGTGIGVFASLGPDRVRLTLRGTYWLPRFAALAGDAGPGIELGAWGATLKACGVPLLGDVTVSLCLGPELGDMWGSGNGLLTNRRTLHEHWSALQAEAWVALKSRAGLTTVLGLELGKTLEAPRFGVRVDGQDQEVFTANGWTVNGYLGLGLFR